MTSTVALIEKKTTKELFVSKLHVDESNLT
jgi:hypothetical protein